MSIFNWFQVPARKTPEERITECRAILQIRKEKTMALTPDAILHNARVEVEIEQEIRALTH